MSRSKISRQKIVDVADPSGTIFPFEIRRLQINKEPNKTLKYVIDNGFPKAKHNIGKRPIATKHQNPLSLYTIRRPNIPTNKINTKISSHI